MIRKLRDFRVSSSLMPIFSIIYIVLLIALIFTGFFGFFFEIAYMFIAYLIYNNARKRLRGFWNAWITCTIVGIPVVLVGFIIFPVFGVLLALVIRIAIIYFYTNW